MIKRALVYGGMVGALLPLSVPADRSADERPNVILIYADDLGIGLLGSYGQRAIETPNIDRLAAEGMRFTNHYGGVFCAPARWSLLTGMHDGRQGAWEHTAAGLPIERDAGLINEEEFQQKLAEIKAGALPIPPEEVFLGQVAQMAGYKTAQFGKLDNGFLTWPERVRRYGWDYHEGYYDHVRAHGFYPPYLWRNGVRFELPGNADPFCGKMSEIGDEPVGSGGETYSQNVFIKGILDYVSRHKDEPFFLYHPTQLPHGPVAIPELHPDYAQHPTWTLAEKKYASMVRLLDDHVGLIMTELKRLGLDENTVVFFTSDNGHELYYGPKRTFPNRTPGGQRTNLTDNKWRTSEHGDVFDGAGGRAGLKRSAYQGGMQCPLIVRWPGKIGAGVKTDRLSANYDFMATLAEIIGGELPEGKDSISFLPTLLRQDQPTVHDHVVINNRFNRMGRTALITKAGWKLVELDREKNRYQLYNLNTDNEERHPVEARHPEILERLKEILRREINSPRPDLL